MSGQRPTREQILATDPGGSNWVGANAGSGKTHVLTQRVARLLLHGAEPHKILCLTYTKAAASEMQSRLFRTLGEWAMASEDSLSRTLANLSGSDLPLRNDNRLAEARRLFARALETPGGLKIQTIHAFCESLLRRFPFEAGISPRFQVADDRQADEILAKIRADMALAAADATDDGFDRAASRLNEGSLNDLAKAVMTRRSDITLSDVEMRIGAHFGPDAEKTPVEIARHAMAALPDAWLRRLADALSAWGGKTERTFAGLIADWLEPAAPQHAELAFKAFAKSVLTDKNMPRTQGLATKGLLNNYPDGAADIAWLADWALNTRNSLLACQTARRTADLHAFGKPLLARYQAAKAARGLLDFDDLISLTSAMLTRSGAREWVLFKLDQGIDHILVDEAQDTSPAQWAVIKEIAEEFLAGEGARPESRSLFVVGDEKQSIYSFQGADPKAFDQMRGYFAERLDALGRPLGRPDLVTSFRSAPAILDFVDAVFEGEAALGLSTSADPPSHLAHRRNDQGRVDLWPLVARPEKNEPADWWLPVDTPPPGNAKEQLADLVATHIQRLLSGERLPARNGNIGRRVSPGDILVLVSKRDQLAKGILRGLKSRGIPVSGADRLKLGDEIAVKDLLALAKVAILPSDDLSLAALLRSPLFGFSEEALFQVAWGREGTLWSALSTDTRHTETAEILRDMMAYADFLRPYEFLMRALVRHDGRRRLLARLGAEAEDAIDELLVQALAMERKITPSLAGFIDWIETGDQQVKREMDAGAGQVRVMTVHGAKGLEAPVVILPDTMSGTSGRGSHPKLMSAITSGNTAPLTLWAGAKEQDDPVSARARAQADAEAQAERRRLLYVALTRAEDWLILCGAEPHQEPKDNWYRLLEAGMDRCSSVQTRPSPTGTGELKRYETGQATRGTEPDRDEVQDHVELVRPDWMVSADQERKTERLAPAYLVEHDQTGGSGLGREIAMLRGTAVHGLLEQPEILQSTEDASKLLSRMTPSLPDEMIPEAIAEARRVLQMPEASWIFGPDALSEVSLAIDPPRPGPRMIGRIDRLVDDGQTLTLIDIKTDAQPPAAGAPPPRAYLAQLGAYLSAMTRMYPEREILAALLWTAVPRLDRVPASTIVSVYDSLRRSS